MIRVTDAAAQLFEQIRGKASEDGTIDTSLLPWPESGIVIGELTLAGAVIYVGARKMKLTDDDVEGGGEPPAMDVRPSYRLGAAPPRVLPEPKVTVRGGLHPKLLWSGPKLDYRKVDLDSLGRDELYGLARVLDIPGRDVMDREELAEAVKSRRNG